MLKSGGEILIDFLLINSLVEMYKFMDEEWQKYIEDIQQMSKDSFSQDELRGMFIKAGFQIINMESSFRTYTYPDYSSFLDVIRSVDDMYTNLPQHLHERYAKHSKYIIREKHIVEICPNTGETIFKYLPITVHAVKI